jgi:hypothetical protein
VQIENVPGEHQVHALGSATTSFVGQPYGEPPVCFGRSVAAEEVAGEVQPLTLTIGKEIRFFFFKVQIRDDG